jgi:putative membrane protein
MVNLNSRPEWSKSILSDEQILKLSKTVSTVESQTEGEILTVLVSKSSHVGHVPWVLFGFLMTTAFIIERTLMAWTWSLWPTSIYLVLFVLLFAMSRFLSKFSWVQRALTSNEDEIKQVNIRAELEFLQGHARNTIGKTGILLFVSLMEQRAVVLADEGIAKHFSPETWNEVVSLLTSEFKNGLYFEGFEKAVLKCGDILKSKLPAEKDNPDQISNHLIIKD